MMRKLGVLVAFLSLAIPVHVFAKAEISKITITAVHLKAPIEITDPKTLANFDVWTGPGTSGTIPKEGDKFVIEWSQGAAERPKGLQRYEVSFYAKLPNERLVYVVLYEYDAVTGRGYIYLPGSGDEWYRLNIGTIFHGEEGRWFRAWTGWDSVARPLIAGATVTTSSTGLDRSSLSAGPKKRSSGQRACSQSPSSLTQSRSWDRF
jgi:hypothetical protein